MATHDLDGDEGWEPVEAPAPYDDVLVDSIELRHRDGSSLFELLGGIRSTWTTEDGRITGAEDEYGATVTKNRVTGKGKYTAMGQAMALRRFYEDDFDFIARAAATQATCVFIHLARDFSQGPTVPYLFQARAEDRIVPMNSVRIMEKTNPAAKTMYVGATTGEMYLRAYNRTYELQSQGLVQPGEDLWRYEMVLRRHHAEAALPAMAALPRATDPETGYTVWPIHDFFNGLLASHMRVVTGPIDRLHRNQRRAKLDPVWADFVAVKYPIARSSLGRVITPAQDLENRFKALKGLAHAYADAVDLAGDAFTEAFLRSGIKKANKHALVARDPEEALRILRRVFGIGSTGAEGGHPV